LERDGRIVDRLVEEGKLALDAPIRKYLTNAPPAWAPVASLHLPALTPGWMKTNSPSGPAPNQ